MCMHNVYTYAPVQCVCSSRMYLIMCAWILLCMFASLCKVFVYIYSFGLYLTYTWILHAFYAMTEIFAHVGVCLSVCIYNMRSIYLKL